ncbi:Arabinanase/levansucrase/invertase [Mycena floridula]|nr:Arabinanase/levansucrase/invertase [Mycena floridula]
MWYPGPSTHDIKKVRAAARAFTAQLVAMIIPLLFVLAAAWHVIGRKNKYIVPGATWYDTDGNIISAHAGGIVETGGKWYWFGQNERIEDTSLFSDIDPTRVVERPKAIFNKQTETWVLWFHADNSSYGLLRQGIATSPNVTGPYTFVDTFSPLGSTSQDFGLFQDVDCNGDADAAHDNLISQMNVNATNVAKNYFDLEAPSMMYTGKRYYILMSHKTGYRPNNVVVFSAEHISGPWSIQSYVAPSGTRTYNSQSTMLIPIKGYTVLYCGDQWSTSKDLYDSRYIWLPAAINDATGGKDYEAEDGVVSGGAYATTCPTCSKSKAVTGITGNATLTITDIIGTGQPQWVSFWYHNPDGLFGDNRGASGQSFILSRSAAVSVNGGAPVTLRQRDSNAGIILSQPLNVTFSAGTKNSITVAGLDDGPAADLDKIVVYGNIYSD